jgi:hypothetical protein
VAASPQANKENKQTNKQTNEGRDDSAHWLTSYSWPHDTWSKNSVAALSAAPTTGRNSKNIASAEGGRSQPGQLGR